jgi:hypothetical protein
MGLCIDWRALRKQCRRLPLLLASCAYGLMGPRIKAESEYARGSAEGKVKRKEFLRLAFVDLITK